MSTEVKRRRGTSTEHETFTGASGEITIDTTENVPVVHDGVTVGGHRGIKELSAVARSLNVKDNQVIYHDDTATPLDGILYILDRSASQVVYGVPLDLGTSETIVSVVENILTTTARQYTLPIVNSSKSGKRVDVETEFNLSPINGGRRIDLESQYIASGESVSYRENGFDVFTSAGNGISITNYTIATQGWGIIAKPSAATGGHNGWFENSLVYGNLVTNNGDPASIAVSIDGDSRNLSVFGNSAYDIQRVGHVRNAYAYAVAGAEDDIPVNDSYNLTFAMNIGQNIRGSGFHVEDACHNIAVIGNNFDEVERGFEVIHDNRPYNHQYSLNNIKYTDEGMFLGGVVDGGIEGLCISFNNINGADATAPTFGAIKLQQRESEGVRYIGNNIINHDDYGIESSARLGCTIAHNYFADLGAEAIKGDSTFTEFIGNNTLVESNNTLKNTDADGFKSGFIAKSGSISLFGDKEAFTDEMNANTEGQSFMFVAEQAGCILKTTLMYTSDAAGGGGTGGQVFLRRYQPNTMVTEDMSSEFLDPDALQFDLKKRSSQNSAITQMYFKKGDVIFAYCNGGASASSKFKLQINYCYIL